MRRVLIALAVLVTALGTLAGNAASGRAHNPNKHVKRLLHEVKAANAKYRSVDRALAAGYVAPPPGACVTSPAGGMGYHFENPALMTDSVLDPLRPEILLYERKKNGRFRLIGVEYYMEADRTTGAPSLFGQVFQGPMPPHHPGMESHYDLHVWLWKKNRSGTFAEWNPRVSCP